MPANLSPVTRWWLYVQRIAPNVSQKDIAAAAGVSQPTVSRWVSGEIEAAGADAAVRLAVEFGADVGEALLAAGVLDEGQLPVTIQRYESPDDETLLRLLEQRLRRDREDVTGNAEHPAPIADEDDLFGLRRAARRDELAERRAQIDAELLEYERRDERDLRAARPGAPAHMSDETTGEESQDPGTDEPA